jgi:type IV pilus assembly protein PilC
MEYLNPVLASGGAQSMATITQGRKKDVQDYLYSWVGQDKSGKAVRGEMRANGENVVVAQLRRQGLSFVKVKKQRVGSGRKITEKDITIFTRQLATLIDSGLPLLRGLTVLGRQEVNPQMKRAVTTISDNVQTGSTFSESLSQFPKVFNKLYVNMVKAGELGGVLEIVLNRLAEYQEKAQKLKNKIVSAMVYPMIVMIIAAVIMALILYTLTLDKLHSIALLKLLGAPDRTILGILLQQAVGLGALGYGIAFLIGQQLFPYFPRRVVITNEDLVQLLVIVLMISVLSSVLGIWRAMRVQPTEALMG